MYVYIATNCIQETTIFEIETTNILKQVIKIIKVIKKNKKIEGLS